MLNGRPYLDDQPEPAEPQTPVSSSAPITENLRARGLLAGVEAICWKASLTVREVCERNAKGLLDRRKPIAQCRAEVLTWIRSTRGWSYPFIADVFDMDHSSVIYAITKLEGRAQKARPSMRAAVIARDGLVCGICGGEVEESEVQIDHILPRSKGGQTTLTNLRVTHRACNLKRGDRGVSGHELSSLGDEAVSDERVSGQYPVTGPAVSCDGPVIKSTASYDGSVEVSRALGSRAVSGSSSLSSQLSVLKSNSHSGEAQTRASARTSQVSKEVEEMAAAIRSHAEFASLDALRIAEKFEAGRINKGTLVAWVVQAIADCALAVTGQPVEPNALQRQLVGYMRNAKAPRQPDSGTRAKARPWGNGGPGNGDAGPGVDYPELKPDKGKPAPMTPERIAQLEALAKGAPPKSRITQFAESTAAIAAAGRAEIEKETDPALLAKARADVARLAAEFGEEAKG